MRCDGATQAVVKAALLFGVSGVGKGFVCDQVAASLPVHLIVGDHIHEDVGRIVAPGAAGIWSPRYAEQWGALPTAGQVFATAITKRYPIPSGCQQLLAEGDFLSLWRKAFMSGLANAGAVPSAVRYFWIDPAPGKVLENLKLRGRKTDEWRNLATEQKRINEYRARLAGTECVRSEDASVLATEIARFLS